MPTSRRSLLSATVAMIAAAPLDVATSAPSSDPIHTLIEAHRRAYAAWNAAIDEFAKIELGPDPQAEEKAKEAEASACFAEGDITHEIATTPPATLGGALAVLDYVMSFYEGRNTETGNSYNFFADEDLIEFKEVTTHYPPPRPCAFSNDPA